jgi:integrase
MAIVKGEKRGRPGRWLVDYRDAAGIRRIVTCATLEEAKDMAASKRHESRQRIVPVVDPNITLDQYAERWLEQVKTTARKIRTWEVYTGLYTRHIKPTLGDRKVRAIQKPHCKALILHKLNENRGRNYVKGMFACLRGLLSSAVDDGVILSNPCTGLSRALKLSKGQAGDDEGEIVAFDRDQLPAFLAAVPPRYFPVFLTLARTGIRPGEALGLQWGDVDLTSRKARITRTWSRGRLGKPKGNRFRTVDLSRQLVEVLRHLRIEQGAAALKAGKPLAVWCFPTESGKPLDEGQLRDVTKLALRRAGLPSHHSPKSLRHTFASIHVSNGESLAWVAAQLGHASPDITMRVYAHWLPPKAVHGGADRLDDARGSNLVSGAVVAGGKVNLPAQITSAAPSSCR